LVYHAALRRTNNDLHLAEDVVQQVFSSLARDAATVARHAVPAGWLYVATRNAAANLMRSEGRRRARELKAMTMQDSSPETVSAQDWERLRPELDGLMDRLDRKDRDAVLLRRMQNRPFAEVGAMLRISEDAARKRVGRALEKLKGLLARRGITSTTAALAASLEGQAGLAAPSGLAARVSGLALTAGGTSSVAKAAVLMNSTTKVIIAVAVAIALVAGESLYVQHRYVVRLQKEVSSLRLAFGGRSAQSDILSSSAKGSTGGSAAGHLSAGAAGRQGAAANPGASKGTSWPSLTGGMIQSADWKNRGTGTPLEALESYLWAVDRVDVDATADTIGFGKWRSQVEAFYAALPDSIRAQYDTPEKLWALVLTGAPHGPPYASYGVVSQAPDPAQPENGVTVDLVIEKANGDTMEGNVQLELTPNGWRYTLQDNLIAPMLNTIQRPK
jgi:RNA polymerase sigma factor (sigma-70 family)